MNSTAGYSGGSIEDAKNSVDIATSSSGFFCDLEDEKVTWTLGDESGHEIQPETLVRDIRSSSPVVHNVVTSCHLSHDINLKTIALQARNIEYNPKRFSAAIMRVRTPRATALIFSTGKLVTLGVASTKDAKSASRKFVKILKKITKLDMTITRFQVHNIVSTFDFGFRINLLRLCADHNKFCHYEPVLFPALTYRLLQPRLTLIVFNSGKVVITGAKSWKDTCSAHKKIVPLLYHYVIGC